jgi:hypothetical protein
MYKINEREHINMAWTHLSYIQGNNKFVFPIEPMYEKPDIMYIPHNTDQYQYMVEKIKTISWNRNLSYKECEFNVKCLSVNDSEIEVGTLESTKAAQEFLQLHMFNPDFDMDKNKVHELWCIMEQRFAASVEGKVEIRANDIVEGSVFDKITIPTLMKNEKAHIIFVGK